MKVHTHTTQNRQQMANANGDDATTPQQAASKVQMLMERLKAGVSFHDLAVAYSEDPQSAPRGGDLGLVPVSRLKQTPPALRDAVLNKPPAVRIWRIWAARTLWSWSSHTNRPDNGTSRCRRCA